MKALVLGVLLAVGCADGMTLSMDAPLPPGGGIDGATETGGADARVCNAAAETLSGRAAYVQGSVAAVMPDALNPFDASQTCGAWAVTLDGSLASEVAISGGAVDGRTTFLVSARATADGCFYTFRVTTVAKAYPIVCDFTADYALIAP